MLDDDILFDDDELKGMLNDDNLDFGDAMDGAAQAEDSEEDEDSEDLDEADFMS